MIPIGLRERAELDMKHILADTLVFQFENLEKSVIDEQLKIERSAYELFDEKDLLKDLLTIGGNITKL